MAGALNPNDFFGGGAPANQGPLTADQAFSTPSPAMGGDAWDHFFSQETSGQGFGPVSEAIKAGGVLKAFGQGFANNWGAYSSEVAQERDSAMKPFLGDVNTQHSAIAKAYNAAVIRPTAYKLLTAYEAAKQAVVGVPSAIVGGLAGAAEQVGGEEAAHTVNLAATFGLPEAHILSMPADIVRAQELGVIGKEVPSTPAAESAAIREQVNQQRGEQQAVQKGEPIPQIEPEPTPSAAPAAQEPVGKGTPPAPTPETPQAAEPQAEAPKVKSVDDVAREMSPAPWQKFDELSTRRDTYRRWLDDMGSERETSPEAAEAQGRIDTILGKVKGNEDRLTNVARDRLQQARGDLEFAAKKVDTPGMALIRENLMTVNHALWDLGPELRASRHEAQAQVHDNIAETTPPVEAAPVADTVRSEIDDATQRVAETVHAELPHKSGTEAGGIAGENAVLPGGADEAGPERGTEAVAGGAGTEPAGGNQAPAEGAGARAEPSGEPGRTGTAVAEREAVDYSTTRRQNPLRPVEGTGPIKTRGLAQGVEAKAIEQGLTTGFGDLPEYRQVSMADQAAKAADFIAQDYDAAKEVALGKKNAPQGLLPESVLVGVEKRALAEGDVDTLRQLATESKLATAATVMGQRIRTLGERDPASPVGAIQEVQRAREEAIKARGEKDIPAAKAKEESAIKAQIRAARPPKQTIKESLVSFAQSIACDY